MTCNNCGNENAENVKFCSGCGAPLAADVQQPAQTVEQQPVQTVEQQPNQAQYQQPNQAQYQQPNQAQYQQPNQAQYQQPNQAQYQQQNPNDDAQQNKAVYVLTYIPMLFFLPLLAVQGSPIGKFHANQSLLILLTSIVLGVVNVILGIALRFLPIFGVFLAGLVSLAIYAIGIALIVVGMVNASKGLQKPLPVIGNMFTIIK